MVVTDIHFSTKPHYMWGFIVFDSIVAKELLSFQLINIEGFGITPTCVPNGKQALELMQDQFDIALIDLHMPEMDGFELSAQIRKNFPDTFIVIFTADITDDAKERINNLNMHDIISKPFVPKEMYNVLLKVWVEKRAME